MSETRLSINDIAKHLHVAKSTISCIINGKAAERRISKDLEKRVLDYVNKIGFKPHHLAQNLATGKSKSIGLIVENIADSFFGPIALMIEEKAMKSGYRIIYSSTRGETETAASILKFFMESHVDGFIIAPPPHMEDKIGQVIHEGIPVIIFDRILNGIDTDYVGTNNQEISFDACTHLVEQGFKKIAIITLDSEQSQMLERLEGYKSCMRHFKQQSIIFKVPYQEIQYMRKNRIMKFFQENPQIDATFFATNYLCISGLEALRELGKSIPETMGVMVFDENDLFRLYHPPITSIVQPLELLSAAIIDNLLQKISLKKPILNNQRIIIPSSLIIRQSTIREKN
ncbi:transcriptional regulator, LacI family [bacterium A37T11]|nr:transcriptional regulator, LacI family [bacterium A37T11]